MTNRTQEAQNVLDHLDKGVALAPLRITTEQYYDNIARGISNPFLLEWCDTCDLSITGEDYDDMHTTHDICWHADCCPQCKDEESQP